MESLKDLCRLCLNESDEMISIYDNTIDEKPLIEVIRQICFKIKISSRDQILNVCERCLSVLTDAHRLCETSAASEIELKRFASMEIEYLEQSKDENLIESEEEEDPDFSQKTNQQRLLKKYECEVCHKLFLRPSKLARHVKTHDVDKKPYACQETDCYARYALPESLQRHQIIHSGLASKVAADFSVKCVVCSEEFKSQEAYTWHMTTHSKKLLPCSSCDKEFEKVRDLWRHSKIHPENKNYKCNVCDKMFSQGSHLIDHLNRHQGLRPHVCKICNKSFQQSSTLKDHVRTHTSEKPFLCSECGKSFNNPSNLRQHVKRHLNLKEFECHLCPGKFSCKASLLSHLRSHDGIKSHTCECGAQFTKGSSLKKHIKAVHEGIKDHQCTTCTMKFSTAEHLKRHSRVHTGEKPYKCLHPGCTKSYAQSNDLLKHKKTHLGSDENIYKCTYEGCVESFRLKSELRNHYVVHKSGNYVE